MPPRDANRVWTSGEITRRIGSLLLKRGCVCGLHAVGSLLGRPAVRVAAPSPRAGPLDCQAILVTAGPFRFLKHFLISF
jgi:hypothetical protein